MSLPIRSLCAAAESVTSPLFTDPLCIYFHDTLPAGDKTYASCQQLIPGQRDKARTGTGNQGVCRDTNAFCALPLDWAVVLLRSSFCAKALFSATQALQICVALDW